MSLALTDGVFSTKIGLFKPKLFNAISLELYDV